MLPSQSENNCVQHFAILGKPMQEVFLPLKGKHELKLLPLLQRKHHKLTLKASQAYIICKNSIRAKF